MQVSVEKSYFLKILSHYQTLIEKRGTSPILSNIFIEAKANTLILKGTDLEMSLVESCPASVQSEGISSVSAHMLYDIVRKMPDHHLTLTTDKNRHLSVKSAHVEFNLATLPPQDFPPIHRQDLAFNLTFSAPLLKNMIESTYFAMSYEEARHSLNGIYFHWHESQWRAVATDAQRLSLTWIPDSAIHSTQNLQEIPGVIMGRKTIGEILKLLENYQHEITLSLSSQQINLQVNHALFSSRLVQGQFPNYMGAIPQNHPYSAIVDAKKLEDAISRVSMVSFEKQRIIKFHFYPQRCVLSAFSTQHGSAVETLSIDYDGPESIYGFNPKHIQDICLQRQSPQLRFRFLNNVSPFLMDYISDPASSTTASLCVLMPTRLPETLMNIPSKPQF